MSRALVTGNRRDTDDSRSADFYATPYAALAALLVAEGRRLPKAIWEPACGNGALVVPLRNRGFDVTATDLHDWGCPGATTGIDFLGTEPNAFAAALSLDNEKWAVCTNPPFNIIKQFVEKAVALAPYVAVLARFNWFESDSRYMWHERLGCQRVHLIVDRLPMMHRHGWDGPRLDKAGLPFAWFVFEHGKKIKKGIPVYKRQWKEDIKKFPLRDEDVLPDAVESFPLFPRACA
jgi:hypothetical protein